MGVPQTNDPAVLQLQSQVAALSAIVNQPSALDRNLDANSKQIITEQVNSQLFDSLWDGTYQYFTEFESLDGFSVSVGVDLFGGGARLTTAGSGVDFQDITKLTAASQVFDSSKRSNFRCVIIVDQLTNQNGSVQIGAPSDEGYGFSFSNSTLNGITVHGGVTKTFPLNITLNDTGTFLLEAKYFPGNRVDFYVNRSLLGTLTTNLPSISIFSGSIWYAKLAETAASAKVMHIYSVEYIQSRS